MQDMNTDPRPPDTSGAAGPGTDFRALLRPEEKQDLGVEICLGEGFCLWDVLIHPLSLGFHSSALLVWAWAPETGLRAVPAPHSCCFLKQQRFPFSCLWVLSRCTWPKLPLSSFFPRWGGLMQSGVCLWAAKRPQPWAQGPLHPPPPSAADAVGTGFVPLCHTDLDQWAQEKITR